MKEQIFVTLTKDELGKIMEESALRAIKVHEQSKSDSFKFYTVDESCEILKISRPTLTRYITDGNVKASKIKGMYRIPFSELEKVLEAPQEYKYRRRN